MACSRFSSSRLPGFLRACVTRANRSCWKSKTAGVGTRRRSGAGGRRWLRRGGSAAVSARTASRPRSPSVMQSRRPSRRRTGNASCCSTRRSADWRHPRRPAQPGGRDLGGPGPGSRAARRRPSGCGWQPLRLSTAAQRPRRTPQPPRPSRRGAVRDRARRTALRQRARAPPAPAQARRLGLTTTDTPTAATASTRRCLTAPVTEQPGSVRFTPRQRQHSATSGRRPVGDRCVPCRAGHRAVRIAAIEDVQELAPEGTAVPIRASSAMAGTA